jgi:predicted RNase H-like HicB family nuclease
MNKKEGYMKTVEVIVEHAGNNLSAYIEGVPVITTGNDVKEIEKNMQEAVELYLESCKEMNIEPVEVLQGEFTLKFKIDAATFINYYSSIFTKAALSRITGINERQLWHYAAGVHKPRKQQLEKIQKGINALTEELAAINLL